VASRGRGGSRNGQIGKAYTNRTDLNPAAKLPISAPSGMQQGMRKQLEDSQRAVPMGRTQAPPVDTSMTPPMPMEQPIPLSAPTQFPNESISDGLKSPMINAKPANEDMQRLKRYIPVIEIAAQTQDAPQVLRDFLLYIKGV
jgi:hypothetical protein